MPVVTDDMFKVISLDGHKTHDEPQVRVRGTNAFLHMDCKVLMLDRDRVGDLLQLLTTTADVMDQQKSLSDPEPGGDQRMGAGR